MSLKRFLACMPLSVLSVHALAANKGRAQAFAEVSGLWRGQVQFLVHNTRDAKPEYFHIGWLVLSVDLSGHVIGRADNGCHVDGLMTPMMLNAPSRVDLLVYRCPHTELDRRFKGSLNKKGEFALSWEMMDGAFPKTVSVTGILFQD